MQRFLICFLTAACLVLLTGCRSGRSEPEPIRHAGDVPVTPLHLGPYLLPFGSEPATTYGIAAGLWCDNADSFGLFLPLGTSFKGGNYGLSLSPVCKFEKYSDFNGIGIGILNPSNVRIRDTVQNGIFSFPFALTSRTNGISLGLLALEKEFNGIDISLCSVCEGENNGLQLVGLDCNADSDGTLNGCQIGWYLRSSVRGIQAGVITYNPCVCDETCLDLGVLNWGLKHGVQVGAFNRTGDGNPLQIGVFNCASSDGSPVQIGLLNYNPNGFLPVFPIVNFSTK